MTALLTNELREGMKAARLGQGPDACPYYATSNSADAWHSGLAFYHFTHGANHLRATSADVISATHGRGYKMNVQCQREDRSRYVATLETIYPRTGQPVAGMVAA